MRTESLNLVFIFIAAVQVVVLICFFYLVGHVSRIRKLMEWPSQRGPEDYYFYIFTGNTEKARIALDEYVWKKYKKVFYYGFNAKRKESEWAKIYNKYSPLYKDIGHEMPKPLNNETSFL